MKNRYLYRYFFKNVLQSFLFWLAMFVVVSEFAAPLLLNFDKLTSQGAVDMQRIILNQINTNLYILGFLLAPMFGIIAGRALVNREGQVLLAHRTSRANFYVHSFLFYGLILLVIWLIFVGIYLLVMHVFNQPIHADLMFKLLVSLFGVLLPYLWVGFCAVNTKPIAAGLIYIVLFVTVPAMAQVLDRQGASVGMMTAGTGLKAISLSVPDVQTFQLIASPFSKLDRSSTNNTTIRLFSYGLLWAVFLLVSGFLVYIRKDMVDPHS
jgi:predicted ABC-type exoprotein transport system permease subunit